MATGTDAAAFAVAVDVLDALPDRVLRFGRQDLVVSYANQAAAAAYGRTPAEVVGTPLTELLPPATIAQLRRHVDALSPTAPVGQQVMRRAGRWVAWEDRLVVTARGEEVISIGRDVTHEHHQALALRESEQRFDRLCEHPLVGVAVLGLDGRFLRVNDTLCRFFGRSREELLTLRSLDVTHPEQVAADAGMGNRVLQGLTTSEAVVTRFVHGDGSDRWGLVSLAAVHGADAQPREMLGQIVDVTASVSVDGPGEVRLDRELIDRLREVDTLKDMFLTAISHELRTPLTVVRGIAELLRTTAGQLEDAQVDQLLERLARNTARLDRLLGDLLDLNRLVHGEPGELRRQPTDLAALVERVVAGSALPTSRLRFELTPIDVEVEPARIERVVDNLLANALRHAPPDEPVRICLRPDAEGVRLTVADAGPGIPDELKEVVFDVFRQVRDDGQAAGGAGLGLAVVRRFVRQHGGRVWVEDRPGGGSEFHVWLPAVGS